MTATTSLTDTLSDVDRRELTDLAHRYAAGVDDRRLSDVAALFCPDGVLVTPGGRSTPPAHHTGREAVLAALSQVERIPVTFHAVVGTTLDPVSSDEAAGRVACVAHHVTAGGPDEGDRDEVWHVVYRDHYRRTPEGWRFARRELQLRFRASRVVVRPEG